MDKRVLFKLGTFSFLCAGVISLWILGLAGLTLNQVAASDQITTTTVTPSVATLNISYVARALTAMPGEKNAKLQEFSLKNNLNKTAYIKVTSFDVLNGDRTALLSTDPTGSQNLDAANLYLGDTLLAKGDLNSAGKIGFNTVISVEALKTSVLTLKGDVAAGVTSKSLVFLINYESTIASGGIVTTTPTSLLVPAGTPSVVTLTVPAPALTQTLIPNLTTSVAKGTTQAQLISIKLTNTGNETLTLSPFGIALQGVDADTDFKDYVANVSFYVNGVKLTGPVITDFSLAAWYNGEKPKLEKGKSMVFTVKGDIIKTLDESSLTFSTIAKGTDKDVKMIDAVGAVSGKAAVITPAEIKTVLNLKSTEDVASFSAALVPNTVTTVEKGATGVQLISIKLTNTGTEDLSFSPFGIAVQDVVAGADFSDYVANTAFYLDGVKLAGPVITDNSVAAFYNANPSPKLEKGKSMVFTVKGDIIKTITVDELTFSTIAKSSTGNVKMISAKGMTSSKVATMTPEEVKTTLKFGAPAETAAYFRFSYPPSTETFVIKLTDPVKIQQARDILSGKITDTTHVMGTVVKTSADYNSPWGFQLDPSSITFFQMAIEVCDSSIQGVQDNLSGVGGAFLPDSRWCPWGSKLIEEVAAPDDGNDDPVKDTYTLKINFGTGSGSYKAGETVAITANPTIATRTFSKWAGDTQYIKDPNSASTTVTMPAKHLTLTAVFKGKPCAITAPATIKDGSMIRAKGGIDVYIVKIKNGKAFKRLILSPQVFKSYGHLKWKDIIEVDQATLDSYITSNYVYVAGESKIWKLDPLGDTGSKSDITESTEIDPDGVYEINTADKESYR